MQTQLLVKPDLWPLMNWMEFDGIYIYIWNDLINREPFWKNIFHPHLQSLVPHGWGWWCTVVPSKITNHTKNQPSLHMFFDAMTFSEYIVLQTAYSASKKPQSLPSPSLEVPPRQICSVPNHLPVAVVLLLHMSNDSTAAKNWRHGLNIPICRSEWTRWSCEETPGPSHSGESNAGPPCVQFGYLVTSCESCSKLYAAAQCDSHATWERESYKLCTLHTISSVLEEFSLKQVWRLQ